MENKNTIHFKQRQMPNCLPHNLEIITVNGGESTSQNHTLLAVAKFTGKQKKIKSGYFIATPRMRWSKSKNYILKTLWLCFQLAPNSGIFIAVHKICYTCTSGFCVMANHIFKQYFWYSDFLAANTSVEKWS